MLSNDTVLRVAGKLQSLPMHWDGRQAIQEMKDHGFGQWRQMEWIGFYFEFLCRRHLPPLMQIPGPRYGQTGFDGFLEVPWDFKAHVSGKSSQVIVNDREAIEQAFQAYGSVGLIVASGTAVYNDEDRSFQKWHQQLKGGQSAYEKERIARQAPSRLRKTEYDLGGLLFLRLTADSLARCTSFQKNFRNADGSLRRSKVLLDLKQVGSDLVHQLRFG